jgi:hypothetical protein
MVIITTHGGLQNWFANLYMVDTPYVSRTVLMNKFFKSLPGRELKVGDNDS